MMNVFKVFHFLSALSSIRRYSDISCEPESVLEHTGITAIVGYFLTLHMNEAAGGDVYSVADVMAKATAHDLDEAITGDILRPAKRLDTNTKGAFNNLASEGIAILLTELGYDIRAGIGFELLSSWKTAKEGNTGLIVEIADLAAISYKIWLEMIVLGRNTMISHANGAKKKVLEVRERVIDSLGDAPEATFLLSFTDDLMEIIDLAIGRDDEIYGIFKSR